MTRGALVVAHGSEDDEWKVLLGECFRQAGLPARLGSVVDYHELGWVSTTLLGPNFAGVESGIRQLQARGAAEIRIIPFFVCDVSSHLMELAQFCTRFAGVTLGHALNDSPLVLRILYDRYLALVQEHCPERTGIVLVGHGAKSEQYRTIWSEWAARTAEGLYSLLVSRPELQRVKIASLHPDSLREEVTECLQNGWVAALLPLFLSAGYYTGQVIPNKLKGLPYLMGSPYLPHPLVSKWLINQLTEYLVDSLDR